jgi:periplasmic copper chaperone A
MGAANALRKPQWTAKARIMNPMRSFLILCAASLFAASPALAHSYRMGAVEIDHPWTRPAPAGATGGGFLVIRNGGSTPVTLVSARTPAARSVSLHQTTVTGGIARMSALPRGLTVAAGATTALAPGGYHLMLEGLTGPLIAGGRAPLTLVFSNGQTVQVELDIQIRPPAAAPAAKGAAAEHAGH